MTVNGISISGTDAGNYSFNTTTTTTADINTRPLTVSATGVNKIYDGTTAATVNLADNRVSGDVFTDSYTSATFSDKNVGTGKTVSVSGISISGTDAGNYTFNTTTSTTANITARALTVSATGVNKVYDGNTTATVTLTDDRVSGDVFTDSYTSANFANKNVGTVKPVSVTGISITGTDAGNYTFNATASTTADITPFGLVITAHGINRVYDSGTTATVTLTDDRFSGDVFTDSYTSATFSDKNVANGKTVSVSGISISGTDAGNYTFNATASTTADITPFGLVITAHGINRVYDSGTTATVTLTDDRFSGDVFTDSYTSATFSDKNVGSGKTVSVSGVSISGTDAGNYTFNTTATTTANITAFALTVSAHGINKVYDSGTTATVTLTDDRFSGDVFTDSYTSASYADKNVGTGKTVSVSGISISGTDAGNYTFNTTASTTADITPFGLTVSATGVNKVYDSTTAATVTLSDNRFSGDVFTDSYTSASFADKNVGTGKPVSVIGISITGVDAGNYTFNTTASTTANITAFALTVSAHGVNKVYDSGTSATVTLTDNRFSGDVFTDSYASASFADKNVGTGKPVSVIGISIAGVDAVNYTFNTTASTTADITPFGLAVSAHGVNKVYDSTTAATVTLSDNRFSGDVFSDSYTTATFSDKNVGTGKTVSVVGISISGTDAGNYTFNTTASTTADITPFGLTVSAHGVNKVYDSTTAATVTLSDNRFSGDVFSDSYTTATFSDKNVGTGKTVSVVGISISGTDADNYTFNTTASTMANITPFGLTVSATGVNKVYDSTTAATVTLSDNRFGGDVFTDSYTSASYADKNVANGKPVSVVGISISGTDADNYTFNTTAGTTADIMPFALTISAHGINKVYDAGTTATVTLTDNRFSGDVFTDSYASASFADKNVGTGKPVSVIGISIAGVDAVNYTFNTTASTTADITPFGLVITAHGINRVYDSGTTATVTLTDDRFSGDVFTDSYTSATFSDKNVGSGKTVSVSGVSISGTDAGNYTFNTTATTTANITAFALTVSAHGINKVYDSGTTATVTLTDNRFGGDVFTDSYASASFADKNVANGKPVSVVGISISGTDADNYTFNTTAGTTADITPFALTISAHGINKVYDAGTTATVTLTDNRFSGDVFTDSYTSASFADKNVANGKPVSVVGISISGTDAGNYTFNTTASTTADITPFALTISAHGVNKVYDAGTSATVTLTDNRFSGDLFTDSYTSASFADKNVGTGKPVSVLGISISGTDAGNYTFNTTASTTANITQRALHVTATGIDKVYDGTTTAAVTLADDKVSSDDVTPSYASALFADKNVGMNKTVSVTGITLSGVDAPNYSFNTTTATSANITQRALHVTATGIDKVYDGTTTAAVTLADDKVSSDDVTPSYASALFADKNVGMNKTVSVTGITLSGVDAPNYSFNTTTATSANITQRALHVTATGIDKVYDGNTTDTVTLADDKVSGDDVTPSYASALFADKNVGMNKAVSVTGITLSGVDAPNYSFNTTTATSANITQRALHVTATGIDKVYDGTTTAAVTLADDKVSGDDVTPSYASALFADKNVGMNKAVSVTGITLSGVDAPNYSFNTTTATSANITQRALHVTATGIDKVYDGNTTDTVTLADDKVSGDDVTPSYASALFADKNVGTSKPVSVSGITLAGVDAPNYSFNTSTTTKANITTKALTVIATGVNRVYDGTTAATVTLSDNRVAGDVFTDAYTSATFSDKNVGTGKTVSVSGISISGTDAGNYTFNTTASTTANITAFALTVTAHGVNKVYDSTTAATVTLLDNRVSGDVFTDSYTSASFADKNVGTAKPVSVIGISISGTDAGNYTFNTIAATTASITTRALVVSATGVNKLYDGTTAATVSLSDNRVSGDLFSDSYTSASFNDKNVGTAKPVSVSGISISGIDAANYTFNTTAGTTANITARALAISATGVNKVYDGTPAATVTLSDNRVSGDVFTDSYTTATFSDVNVGNGKTVSVSGISISGTDAGNYTFNTSAMTTANITKNPTTISITSPSSPKNIVFGSTLPISASVLGNPPLFGSPDGSVQFMDGAANLGSAVPVTIGVATLPVSNLSVGSHTITAVYSGSGNFFGSSTTASITVVVIPSINVTFLPPLAGQPVGNKIKVGQVVPHKVDLVNSLGQSVTSGITVKLKVLGVDTNCVTGIFQDVIEDANGVGNDGTVTSDGIMAYTGGHWQFNLDTSNFSDPNTYSESARYYTSTVSVIDNITMLTVGTLTINLETGK